MSAKATKVRTRQSALAAGDNFPALVAFSPRSGCDALEPKPSGTSAGSGGHVSDLVRDCATPGMFRPRLHETRGVIPRSREAFIAPSRPVSA